MKKHKIYNNWPLIIILLFGLTPLLWYKSGYIIARGDYFPFWLNPLNTFFHSAFLWQPENGGSPTIWSRYPVVGTIWYFFRSLHISVPVIQITFIIFYFLGAGLAIYFLATTIYKKQRVIAFIASLFYMFNFYTLLRILHIGIGVSWTLVFLPLLLAFYVIIVKNMKDSQNTTRNVIAFAFISTILTSFASINPPLLAIIFITWFFMFLYYFITEKAIRIKIVRNLLALSIIVFLINIWWIIPFLTRLLPVISGSTIVGTVIDVTKWEWTHSRASFLNLFWLNGHWSWRPKYFPYIDAYSNPVLQFLVFIPMIIAFIGFLFKNGYRKINLYFGIVILFLMFLAKGLHFPLGNINLFLYKYIPGFFLFREPFPKFYVILIIFLPLLIGSSCNSIIEYIRKTKSSYKNALSGIFTVFIIVNFLISTFPLLTGEVIPRESKILPFSSYIRVPHYWYEIADYLNNKDEDFKLLITPEDDFYQMPYRWGYYGAGNLPAICLLYTSPSPRD